jgi:GT2 family glycosyltransferase
VLSPEANVASPDLVADVHGTIYVLLPVHDRRRVTEQFVRCLLDQSDQGFQLVLIDDGSTDGTADAVTALLPTTIVLRGPGSWWWAGSLQEGQRWLLGRRPTADDIVVIANDDTRFDADFLAAGRAALAGSRRKLLLAQLYTDGSGELVEVGVDVDWRRLKTRGVKDPKAVNCFSTRGLFVRAVDFLDIGGFHTRLLPHYLSDYEFTIRARRQGFELASDPTVKLWYDPTTTGIRSVSRRSVRDYLRTTISRRSVSNPIYWTTFLLLACPRRQLPRNVFRIWRSFARGLAVAARNEGRA